MKKAIAFGSAAALVASLGIGVGQSANGTLGSLDDRADSRSGDRSQVTHHALRIAASLDAGADAEVAPLVSGQVSSFDEVRAVSVSLRPRDSILQKMEIGDAVALLQLPAAETAVDGNSFAVAVDPSSVPADYISNEGVVSMIVRVSDGTSTDVSYASARAVTLVGPSSAGARQSGVGAASGLAWADPVASSHWASENGASRRGKVSFAKLRTTSVEAARTKLLAARSVATDADARAGEEALGVAVAEFASPGMGPLAEADPWPGCTETKLAERTRSTTIGTTYPVGGDKAKMSVSSSRGASYGVAVQGKNAATGEWGSFRVGESKFTRSGWGFDWDGSTEARSYRKGIEYHKVETDCVRGCNKCLRTWIPVGETGGVGENSEGVNRPTWQKCSAINSKGFWWRDEGGGHAYTFDAAVKFAEVIGIDLSIERSWNEDNRIGYNMTKGRRLCGSGDDWPSVAGKVMERF